MVKRALIERRPWLLASVLFGASWWFIEGGGMAGAYQLVWKGLPVAMLAVYAWQRRLGGDGALVTAMLAFSALGDAISTLEYRTAGILHAIAHLFAITLYLGNRRAQPAPSQLGLGAALIVLTPLLAWLLAAGTQGRGLIAAYSGLLALMAAAAWTSRFPRYRVGIGAVLYVLSNLVLIAARDPLAEARWGSGEGAMMLVWPLYYIGQLLIATGVVTTLRRAAE